MYVFVVLILLGICLSAPWLGRDTSDARSEDARPVQGWFPLLDDR